MYLRLPNLGWLNNWDNCLRLRVGVVDAYVNCPLGLESFKRLTVNYEIFGRLIDVAISSKKGRAFIKPLGLSDDK